MTLRASCNQMGRKMSTEDLKERSEGIWTAVEGVVGERNALTKLIGTVRDSVEEAEGQSEDLNVLHPIFLAVSNQERKKIQEDIESLVTYALQSVFETEDLSFHVEFVDRRNQVEADFVIESAIAGKIRRGDIVGSFGGSVSDVISTILRLVFLELLQLPGPLVLDEPGRMIRNDKMPNFGRLLKELSQRTGRQIICITHSDVLAQFGDKTFEVDQLGGVSLVVEKQ